MKTTSTIKNLFATINFTYRPAGSSGNKGMGMNREQRRAKVVAELKAGKTTGLRYDSMKKEDRATRKLVRKEIALSPGKLVEFAIKAVGLGATVIELTFEEDPIAKRMDWSLAKDAIMAAVAEAKVDPNTMAHVFGLVATEDKVVPSNPGTDEPVLEVTEQAEVETPAKSIEQERAEAVAAGRAERKARRNRAA